MLGFIFVLALVTPSSRSVRLHGVLKHILACKCEWKGRGGYCVRHFGFFPGLLSVWEGRLFGDVSAEKVLCVSFKWNREKFETWLKRRAAPLPCRMDHNGKAHSLPQLPSLLQRAGGATFVSAEFFWSVKKKKRVYCDLWTSHSSDPARLDITSHCCNVFACSLWRLTRLSACFKFKFANLVLHCCSYRAKGTENKDIWFPYYLLVLIKSRSLVVLLKVTFILFFQFFNITEILICEGCLLSSIF